MANCRLTKTKFTECSLMAANLADVANSRTKGLALVRLTNVKTFKERDVGVIYRTTAGEKGYFLHYCPWCGKKITPFFMRRE